MGEYSIEVLSEQEKKLKYHKGKDRQIRLNKNENVFMKKDKRQTVENICKSQM